ncbi:hypothetical protein [Agromyces salentinus]|uniref:Uncharacterized protein n=1 Tax=Agromyces salentinus TaxID=269421 RepID=A0ABN2MQW5_9MICO|nr:hypothetical protein [Agromyces salentinus]
MDPNTARQVLRIFPDAPLTADLVEGAFAAESWARLPSRYADPAQREQAEAWATTLAAARIALLAELPSAASGPIAAPVAAHRTRGLGAWAITGIVAGALVLVAFLAVASIGAAWLASSTAESVQQGQEGQQEQGEDVSVERYEPDETLYEFAAALELYGDGRYDELCGAEYASGCWQNALFTEDDCSSLEVVIDFSNDEDAWEGETEGILEFEQVAAGEALPVVYGDDDYDYGWVSEVRCLDGGGGRA